MRRVWVLMCMVAFGLSPMVAQNSVPNSPPPTVQEVMRFFEVMEIRAQMQNILQAEQKQIQVTFADMFGKLLPNATPKEREQFQALMNSTMNDLITSYPIEDILRDMVPIYQKHLTEADLDAVVAFYSSPVGRKMLKEMPAMTSEAMRVSFARVQPKMEEIMKNMQHRIEEMAAADKSAAGKSGTAGPEQKPPNHD